MNGELRNRSTDLNSANAFLESVFTSLRYAVVVLDHDYRVQVWNQRAEQLWGVRADEACQTRFLGMDIGLPVDQLKPAIREVLNGGQEHVETVLPSTNRRGKAILCRVNMTPLRALDKTVNGVILLMEEVQEPS